MRVSTPIAATLFTVAVFLGACSEATTSTLVASVTVPAAARSLSLHERTILFANFYQADGTRIESITGRWSSGNPSIVDIDADGNVYGRGLGGPVTVTVSAHGHSASVEVTVTPHQIAITPGAATLELGTTRQLSGVALDVDGMPIETPVTWNSSNPAVATVSSATGFLSSIASGVTIVTATAAGRTDTLELEVGVPTPLDGHWAGNTVAVGNQPARPVEFDVVFGSVRRFTLRAAGDANSGLGNPCLYDFVARSQDAAPIANSGFEATVRAPTSTAVSSTTVSGTFEDLVSMNGTYSNFVIGEAACSATNATQLREVRVGPGSIVATKQ